MWRKQSRDAQLLWRTGLSVFNQVASCLCAASISETNGSKGLLQASFKCSVETLLARREHSILLHFIWWLISRFTFASNLIYFPRVSIACSQVAPSPWDIESHFLRLMPFVAQETQFHTLDRCPKMIFNVQKWHFTSYISDKTTFDQKQPPPHCVNMSGRNSVWGSL